MSEAPSPPGTDPATPLQGEPLALELVNTTFVEGGTRGHQVDVLREPHQLDQWLTSHREAFSPELREPLTRLRTTPDQVGAFRRLRQALRECLQAITAGQTPAAPALAVINETAREAAHWLEATPADPVTVSRRWATQDWIRIAAGEIATTGCELMGPLREQLRACPALGCILFFVKTHPRREWCTPACGNRVRVARHGRRHRPEPNQPR